MADDEYQLCLASRYRRPKSQAIVDRHPADIGRGCVKTHPSPKLNQRIETG